MRKKIFGAITFIAAIGGVIYMKNNPKYKEIVQKVKNADARGLYEKIILEKTGFTPKIIMEKVKLLYSTAYQDLGEEKWASYDRMNESILQLLSKRT